MSATASVCTLPPARWHAPLPASLILVLAGLALALPAAASSHREAPAITRTPQVDATDFYLFRSYEAGREDTITIIANYHPLQDP
ncbi:MAG TPA: DUF4331 family protein, partial [Thermoanaerobaculia bacterium]|nr:DUF4331 family protein [Thermoanaerobaculia bacterium]